MNYHLTITQEYDAWKKEIDALTREVGSWWFVWGSTRRLKRAKLAGLLRIGSQYNAHSPVRSRARERNIPETLLAAEKALGSYTD